MTQTQTPTPDTRSESPTTGLSGLWNRKLAHYPNTGPRYLYLGITVLATITLYYQLYVQGAVATKIISTYQMTFSQFVSVSVVGALAGAFASLAAGFADRWGRANLVVFGLVITALLVLFALPQAPSRGWYLFYFAFLSIVEGVILVATPALIRDFSPQVGRASAMAFWTMGPVLGSVVVTTVSSLTLDTHTDWRFQFHVCGVIGLVVAVIAFIGLRELSPGLRDQLMVSLRERALVESRAHGIDTEEAFRGQWRQMLKLDVAGPAVAISLFLAFYYIAGGFFVVYFTSVFGYSEARANSLANWYSGSIAASLLVVGVLSDRLRVRKPFMATGAAISIVGMVIFALLAKRPETTFAEFAAVLVVCGVGTGLAYCAWMAGYTETVERRNPAATATGLAIWGWTMRTVVTVTLVALPVVVPATSVLVDQGSRVAAIVSAYPDQVGTAKAVSPDTLASLAADPTNPEVGAAAVKQLIAAGLAANPAEAAARLQQLRADPIPAPDQEYLALHASEVIQAKTDAPGQWQTWWWLCAAAQVVFVPFIFVTAGRWSPKKARQDAAEHDARVECELAALRES